MSRDSGSEHQPGQRTVADLLKEYGTEGGEAQSGSSADRRRRRRSDDVGDTAPHQIIDRVLSDSGQMRPVRPDDEPRQGSGHHRSRRRLQAQPGPGEQPASPGQPQQPAPEQSASGQSAPPGQAPPPGQHPPQAGQVPPGAPPGGQALAGPPPGQASAGQVPSGQVPTGQPPSGQADPAAAASEPTAKVRPVQPDQNPGTQNSATQNPVARTSGQPRTARTPAPDPEATVRQTFAQPQPPEKPQQNSPQQTPPQQQYSGQQAVSGQLEGVTEQLPPVPPEPGPTGTRMVEDPYARGAVDPSPSRPGIPARPAEQPGFPGYPDDPAFDHDDYAEDADDDSYDDFDDARDELFGDDERGERSPGKEWFVLTGQGFGGLLVGAVVFFGFMQLWKASSVAAFVAALVVTGALVLFARRMRGDDLQIILLAVLAGLFCTVSPVALLLLR